jgi:hypothetical protein
MEETGNTSAPVRDLDLIWFPEIVDSRQLEDLL